MLETKLKNCKSRSQKALILVGIRIEQIKAPFTNVIVKSQSIHHMIWIILTKPRKWRLKEVEDQQFWPWIGSKSVIIRECKRRRLENLMLISKEKIQNLNYRLNLYRLGQRNPTFNQRQNPNFLNLKRKLAKSKKK